MEACGSAHHWARWLNGLGIEVRLLPAAYVRAYVKRNKTDAADACALLEAARCAEISRCGSSRSSSRPCKDCIAPARCGWARAPRVSTRCAASAGSSALSSPRAARLGVEQISRVLADPHAAVPDADPRHDDAAGRGDPLAGSAHRAARTRAERARPPIARLHHAAVDPRRRLADRHGHGGRHLAAASATSRRAALRLLVRPHPKEHSSGSTRHLGRISKRGDRYLRMLLTHGARSVLRAATVAAHRAGASMACGNGRSACRAAPITTRRPARWPTSWRASATPRCATTNPTAAAPPEQEDRAHGSSPCRPEDHSEPVSPYPEPCVEIDRPSWQTGSSPHRLTPITLPAASRLPLAAIGAAGTQIPCRHGPPRAHYRCRIYDCRLTPTATTIDQSLALAGGVHI